MFKKLNKLLLIGVVGMVIFAMAAPCTAYVWNGYYFGSLNGQVCGARGGSWTSYAHITATISEVECYCRNKPNNSNFGKSSFFIGTNYTIDELVSEADVPQDSNGCYPASIDVSEADAVDAAEAAGAGCPNKNNWNLYCRATLIDSYWEVWYGQEGECELGAEGPDCTLDDTCNVQWYNIDWDAMTADFDADCL
jgi:hypothetical protein